MKQHGERQIIDLEYGGDVAMSEVPGVDGTSRPREAEVRSLRDHSLNVAC